MNIAHAKTMLAHLESVSQPVTSPRFYIGGESKCDRGEFSLFEVELCTEDGHEYVEVWARNGAEALIFVAQFRHGKLAELVERRP